MATSTTDWFIYIIQTQSGKLYTGITTDPVRRYQQHCQGNGAKFFRTDPPKKMVYQEKVNSKSAALKKEYLIKQMTRKQKLALISEWLKL
jgi:putative endonuclease